MSLPYLKIIRTGDIYERYTYEKHPNPPGQRKGVPRDRPKYPVKRSPYGIKRTRQNFLRLVRSNCGSNGAPTLLTLTVHNDMGIEMGYRCLTHYLSDIRRYFGKELRYVAVPEFQKRGAVHFHLLVWGLPKEVVFHETSYQDWLKKAFRQSKLFARWNSWAESNGFKPTDARGDRILQNLWSLGFVDCVPTDGSLALAGYLAKYMRKSMHDERLEGYKAYLCSRNVMRPVSSSTSQGFAVPEIAEVVFGDNELLYEKEFDTLFMGRCNYKMFKVNTYGNKDQGSPVGGESV